MIVGCDARQDLRDRQQQARQVAAWLCVIPERRETTKRWFLAIENSSSVPVYRAEAAVNATHPPSPLTAAMIPPGRTYFELVRRDWEYGVQVEELDMAPRPLTQAENFKVVTFSFTDAGGARWTRDDVGHLTESVPAAPR